MSVIDHEPVVRLASFAGVLALMALWEALAPRRRLRTARPGRWLSNLGLAALNTLAMRFLLPLSAVGVALTAEERGWGLFHLVALPAWLAVPLAVVALDLVLYLQHVLFHAVPVLWRLHMVHHADLDFDVTTGVRFHTLEMLLSLGIKAAAVVLLGAAPLAVLLFEVLLNATSMFSHGNVRLPGWLDRLLRLVLVTPEMHRVHHSPDPESVWLGRTGQRPCRNPKIQVAAPDGCLTATGEEPERRRRGRWSPARCLTWKPSPPLPNWAASRPPLGPWG